MSTSSGAAANELGLTTTGSFRPAIPIALSLFAAPGVGVGAPGRRSRAVTSAGRTVGAIPAQHSNGRLHLTATIHAAAPHQAVRGRRPAERLRLANHDLRLAVTEGRESNLVLLVVDASGSMSARRRMEAVKAAALSAAARCLPAPGQGGLDHLPWRRGERWPCRRHPRSTPPRAGWSSCRVVAVRRSRRVCSAPRKRCGWNGSAIHGAGRCSSWSPTAVPPTDRTRSADRCLIADRLRQTGVASLMIDCESGRMALGLAQTLSIHLGAQYVTVGEVAADQLVAAVRQGRAA